MSLAEKLKAARKKAAMTQAEADALCGLGKGTFASWESGRYVPHQYMQSGALAELAGVHVKRKAPNDLSSPASGGAEDDC